MWLLRTDRAELHCFHNLEDVPGGYAILSHVWSEDEQSFQDIQELQLLCVNNGQELASRNAFGPVMSNNPRDHACAKIRHSCVIAEEEGYEWIWNDTCCIETNDSVNISETINAMFRYYSEAEVCFAYLPDVSLTASLATTTAEFRASKWHKRGWTLIELIAPTSVLFLSRDWTYLGSKHDFSLLLESITRVPASLLTGEETLSKFSVAQRMSWASGRETTREEDRAYSLLGIFGLHMTIRYGEGAGAFQRLQRKIAKKSTADSSLFSWGRRLTWSWFCQSFSTEPPHQAHDVSDLYLLSPSSDHFQPTRGNSCTMSFSGVFEDTSVQNDRLVGDIDMPTTSRRPLPSMPTHTATPDGVIFRIPVFQSATFSVAIICCSDIDGYLGLVLTRRPDWLDPHAPLYRTGWTFGGDGSSSQTIRIVTLGHDLNALRFAGHPVTFVWKEMFLAWHPLYSTFEHRLTSSVAPMPFLVLQSVLNVLVQHGWEQLPVPRPWTLVDIVFHYMGLKGNEVFLALGRCSKHARTDSTTSAIPTEHWANLSVSTSKGPQPRIQSPPNHELADHIPEWPGLRKEFGVSRDECSITLSVLFKPCDRNPSTTMVFTAASFGHNDGAGKGADASASM
ncbi:HET-domain-containing protein [Ganoderma leucocontextum]|nr:HET-domain-containing protein [Ganoderma leucocontextum]